MAINTPTVVAGELITSAWGNTVRADLLALDTGKLSLSGGAMTGTLNMGTNAITNLPIAPAASNQAMSAVAVEGRFLALSGGTVGGNVTVDPGDIIVGAEPNSANGIRLRGTVGDLRGRMTITSGPAGAGTPPLSVARSNGVTGHLLVTWLSGVQTTIIGSVSMASATSVAYNTTSDPRLKQRVADADDATAIVRRLGRAVFRGRWRNPETLAPEGDVWHMLSSHDVEDAAPYAVTGERDALNDDGSIDPQQVDRSALVPVLLAALADALDRLDAIENAGAVE